MNPRRIAVLGDGAWGTTLAILLRGNGHPVRLWGAFPDHIAALERQRENVKFLPGVPIPDSVELTADLARALDQADVVVSAVPSHVVREVCQKLRPVLTPTRAVSLYVNVSKGIETHSLRRMSEVITEILGPVPLAVLSGPSHAEEVSRLVPTAVSCASADPGLARETQRLFSTRTFRVYTSTDLVGLELGGSVKNVIAVAAGICDGLGMGDNTKAALMTRGLHEMARLGARLGADPRTFSGLSGLGDLVVTCTSRHSRNRGFGEAIGKGRPVAEILSHTEQAIEGYRTALSLHQWCEQMKIDMPIARQVYDIVYAGKSPRQAVTELMERSLKDELEL